MTADLLEKVKHAIDRHALIAPGETVVIGVSGGVDSLVLLHVLCRLRDSLPFTLHAATLDHGLRGEAGAADAEFVRVIAGEWGVPVTVGRADVLAVARDHHMNPEEAARQVRYTFLARVAQQVGAAKIAVAHHQDDQAETVLMHLIRGSGLDGLRGMLPATPLNTKSLLDDVPLEETPSLVPSPASGKGMDFLPCSAGDTVGELALTPGPSPIKNMGEGNPSQGFAPPLQLDWRGGQGVRLS